MYVNTYEIFSSLRGDKMKIVKSFALMALGATAVLAYQRYSDDVLYAVEKMVKKKAKCACEELEDMM